MPVRADPLKAAYDEVNLLYLALSTGGSGLSGVPFRLKRVLESGCWREFSDPFDKVHHWDRFEDFLEAKPLKGMGSTVAITKALLRGDNEASDLLDQALQRPNGGDRRSEDRPTRLSNAQSDSPATGTRDRALRKLRKDAPDLHTQVLAGELSPHAAMVKAGFRPKTLTVRLDDMSRLADTLTRHLSAEQSADLACRLRPRPA